ncbi:MAG: hypothetical protein KFB93_00090 [Simkaniaceae bacterium]|jgi:hypothetical protein|nr:MAG: hypothetical protein KFB93_00090 [Simkaniaceae bacterium]
MTTVTNSTAQPHSIDLLSDLHDEGEITLPGSDLSERAEELAGGILGEPLTPPPTKRAYFWVKAKDGDEAFRSKDMDSDREANIKMLKMQGYEVTLFKGNRAFFDHIKTDPSQVDLLVISDHGTPYQVGDLWVRGENIISKGTDLSEEEQTNGFKSLRSIMKKDSILLFDACLAGNKTIEKNIARAASRILPQTRVYASQHETEYEPRIFYKMDDEKGVVIDTIMYSFREEDSATFTKPVMPTIYYDGVETTNQDPVTIRPELFAKRKPKGYNPYAVGAVVLTIAATIGISASYFGVLPSFNMNLLPHGFV